MKPMNFPARKKARQIAAVKRLAHPHISGETVTARWVMDGRFDLINPLRQIKSKKSRAPRSI